MLKCCYVLYIDATSQGPGRMTVDVANGELKQILEECLTPSARHGLKIYGVGKLHFCKALAYTVHAYLEPVTQKVAPHYSAKKHLAYIQSVH